MSFPVNFLGKMLDIWCQSSQLTTNLGDEMSESWAFICVLLLVFLRMEGNIWILLSERQWSRCLWHRNPPYRSFLAMTILSQLLEFMPLSMWHFNRRQIQVITNRYKPFRPKWLVLATSSCWQALFQKFVNIILAHLFFPSTNLNLRQAFIL